MKLHHLLLIGAALSVAAAMPASANTITWTDWTSATVGDAGSASGTAGAVSVSYSGQVFGQTVTNGSFTSFAPASSFQGGVVGNAPDTGDIIALTGANVGAAPQTNTITFGTTVTNPIIAI